MKKIALLIMSAFLVSCLSCKSSEKSVKETPAPARDDAAWLSASNSMLAKAPVDGFDYKGSAVPKQKWENWAAVSAPAVKKIVDEMPDGYVLQIKGHTDARGPEGPEGDKPGNTKISTDRAKAVYELLKSKGISSSKITFTGVGASELKPGVDPKSPEQRRVTFSVMAK